jgi:hypothetical protein
MFVLDRAMAVDRVVLRLLRRVPAEEMAAAIESILAQLTSLSGKSNLLLLVGHVKDAGHKLISVEESKRAWSKLWNEMRRADPHRLCDEWDLATMLYFVSKEGGGGQLPLTPPVSAELTLAVLKSATSEAASQGMDSRSVSFHPHMQWPLVQGIFGSDDAIQGALDLLKRAKLEGAEASLALAEGYLAGRRSPDSPLMDAIDG